MYQLIALFACAADPSAVCSAGYEDQHTKASCEAVIAKLENEPFHYYIRDIGKTVITADEFNANMVYFTNATWICEAK